MIKRIYIEITNICNMKCSFCSPSVRKKRTMSVEEFKHILNQIKTLDFLPLPQLYLHVKGEPLMHTELQSILSQCEEYGFKVNITTNGTLLSNVGRVLANSSAVRQVNISLHSFEKNQFIDEVCQIEESQTAYLKAVTDFALHCKNKGTPIVVFRLWKSGYNNLDVSGAFSLDYITKVFGNGDFKTHGGKDNVKLCENVYISFDQEFEWPSLSHGIIANQGKCLGGKEMLAILADGSVTACCLDADGVIDLGNIFTENLADIIAKQRYKELVKGFSGGNISEELCKKCSYRLRFDKGESKVCVAEKRNI